MSDPNGEYGNILNPNLVTFDRLQSISCLVLLGEPGIGKSWSISSDANAYQSQALDGTTLRLDLRGFGSEDRLYRALFEDDGFVRWAAGKRDLHLYLDSLDECLLRIESVAALLADELPKYELSRLKLRIACRTASWPSLLENALKSGYGEEHFGAVELVPLRRIDVEQAATLSGIRATAFLDRVDELGIASFAIKPVTLKMLLDIFERVGDLPSDVLDLYEKGCTSLCEEQSESRRAAGRFGSLTAGERIAVASRIAAATQFGNRFAIWTGNEGGLSEEDIAIRELIGGNEPSENPVKVTFDAVSETLDTGLFSSRGQERLGWSHQTFAEYLAARYCTKHRLPIQQLRSLIFHPRRRRVIPQLRDVACWVALQNPELFAELAELDPEVLLGSASPSLSEQQRKVALDALLKRSERGEFLHAKQNLELHNLAHPSAANQLKPVIADRSRSVETRYFAIKIVRYCVVQGIGDVLVEIALCDAEPCGLRTLAAYAVAEVGSDEDRSRLEPLLQTTPQLDPDDELRGAALKAVFPGVKYNDSIWKYLEQPRNSSLFGSYSSFLSSSMLPKLNVSNVAAALLWCQSQEPQDLGPVSELQHQIIVFALKHIEADGVANLLARTVFKWASSGKQMPRQLRSPTFSEMLEEDDVRRRRFLEEFLPLLGPENAHLALFSPRVLIHNDIYWLLERVVTEVDPALAQTEVELISRLAIAWEAESLNAVWEACQRSKIVAAKCMPLFEPVSLDSDFAKWGRDSQTRKMNAATAPALKPRCEAALQRSEEGDPDQWLQLMADMSLDVGGTHYMHFREMQVDKLPGWLEASDEMRVRVTAAAKRFLTLSEFRHLPWFPSLQIPHGALAGVNALALLYSIDPTYLKQQSAEFWGWWIPSLIGDARAGSDKNDAIDSVFQMAASVAPVETRRRLLDQIKFESNSRDFLFATGLIETGWSEALGLDLLALLQQGGLAPRVESELVSKLIKHAIPGSKKWVEQLVQTSDKSPRILAMSKALLVASDDAGWTTLWPIIQTDAEFGRQLLEDASYGAFEAPSFTSVLSDSQLGDLYIWLLEQYPPDDRIVSGAIGPSETIRFLRDGILESLKKRATFAACDGLARAELHFPQYRWLRYHFDEAELAACASTWQAESPRDIIAMSADSRKRFVESGEQLIDLVIESLCRLETELHGELPSIGDLWNSSKGEWWPKDEEYLSDYVARHLKKDLSDRGIVINREVQIRRGHKGEMPGQNTDIHVDAIPAEAGTRELYGPITLILEVKGSWNRGLMLDMERQLRDRYMRNADCRAGLYLVGHFRATRWIESDGRRKESEALDIEDLRKQLTNQAKELCGSVLIRSYVLDCSLDSTVAKISSINVAEEKT